MTKPRRWRSHTCRSLPGITLLELLLVLSIISLCLSLLLPAIHAARESARSIKCKSNLRQLAIAMISGIDRDRCLPENRFDKDGMLEKNGLWFDRYRGLLEDTFVDKKHGRTIEILKCPSSPIATLLSPISESFNGPEIADGWAETLDYVSNAGVSSVFEHGQDYRPSVARVGVAADVFSPTSVRRVGQVTGGLSNTFVAWECSGSKIHTLSRLDWSLSGKSWDELPEPVTLFSDFGMERETKIIGRSNVRRYVASSLGFNRGYIALYDWGLNPIKTSTPTQLHSRRVVNVTNRYHGPFAFHADLANFALLDGSVSSFSWDTDHQVMMAYATIVADGN